jgi:hypothetical protein
MAKTWTEKLNAADEPVVKPAPIAIAGMKAGQMMLRPTARMIDRFIRAVPRGRRTTVATMRSELARRAGAEVACPIYTGFHIRTVAEAAWEAFAAGAPLSSITPFWRILDAASPTGKRLACGTRFIRDRRREEGLEP